LKQIFSRLSFNCHTEMLDICTISLQCLQPFHPLEMAVSLVGSLSIFKPKLDLALSPSPSVARLQPVPSAGCLQSSLICWACLTQSSWEGSKGSCLLCLLFQRPCWDKY